MSRGHHLGEGPLAEGAERPVPHALADMHLSQSRQMRHVNVAGELAVDLCPGEQLAEHVGVDIVGAITGEDAALLAVALQDRLDDQVARVAGHRALEAAQRLGDDGLHVVGTRQVLVHCFLRGPGGQQADLEEHVFLGGEVEVEQRAGDACGPADVGDRRLGIAVGAPQRHRGLHQ